MLHFPSITRAVTWRVGPRRGPVTPGDGPGFRKVQVSNTGLLSQNGNLPVNVYSMIDWFKVRVQVRHSPVNSGACILVDPTGEVIRETSIHHQIEGSHEQVIAVRSYGSEGEGMASHLEISGNPAKFLQGHNVFGSDDIRMLTYYTAISIVEKLGLTMTPHEKSLLENGESDLTWVDINYPYEMECQTDVQAWIRAAEFKARTRSGRPARKGSTVYFQKHSRRWAIKAYSKFLELTSNKKHRLPIQLEDTGLLKWTSNILRIELRLLGKELRDLEIFKVKDLPAKRVKQLFGDYMNKIVMTDQIKLPGEIVENLPRAVRNTYTLWSDGHYVSEMMSSSTFYRHRTLLLEHGIDISISVDKEKSNVIPMIRVVEAKPAQIPDWAYEEGLIFDPALREAS